MTPQQIEQHRQVLGQYVPASAVDSLLGFMLQHKVHLVVAPHRQTKLGDYCGTLPRHPYHEISVNGDLNPYFFLWVLLHEMAHLNTFLLYERRVKAHGHEWQEEYRKLLVEYAHHFPAELHQLVEHYCARIPLSHTVRDEIEQRLRDYGTEKEGRAALTLNDVGANVVFRLKEGPPLRLAATHKMRTRWRCVDVDTGREYFVYGKAEVVKA